MQHTKYYLRASYNCAAHKDGPRAAHKDGPRAAHKIYIARMLYTKVNSLVTRKFRLSYSTKIGHMRVLACECQLRCELYRSSYKTLLTLNIILLKVLTLLQNSQYS